MLSWTKRYVGQQKLGKLDGRTAFFERGAMWGGYRNFFSFWLLIQLIWIQVNGEAIRCCSLANGSCRSACEKISLVSVAINPDELQIKLHKINELCHRSYMTSFWECLNETLSVLDKGVGWIGRPCCHIPQSEKCKMSCLQAQSKLDLQSTCRQSDELTFFACLERQEAGEKCCRNAPTSNCAYACKEVYASSFTPSKQVREAVNKYCLSDSSKIQQCLADLTHVTPADHAFKSIHCCERSLKGHQCKTTCKEMLRTGTTNQEIMDTLINSGCGPPLPQDPMWQCFLQHSGRNSEPGGSLIQSEKVGMDSAKLQCCFRAATVNCQRLCKETFSDQWRNTWNDFDRLCQYQPAESDMIRCLAEVDEPCELGCEALSYCTNFNYRPTELFRNCNEAADRAAQIDIESWEKGMITLPMMTIPVLRISKCHPDMWKAIACALQIKPCLKDARADMICKSECISILTKCVDRSRLTPGHNPITICENLSPIGNDSHCISLTPYLVPSKHAQTALEVTHPCKPNPCSENDVCMVDRNCLHGQPCMHHKCVPGCKMGDISQLVLPRNSPVRVPSNTHGPRCHMVCYCNQSAVLEDCATQPCPTEEDCWHEGVKYNHNSRFKIGCNTCFCHSGEVMCSKKHCGLGLPCDCPDHYVPVCGANGKTYPSVCLARCAGLSDDQYEFGACHESDPCSPNSCHPYDRCVPRKRVCLSIHHRSCKQYDCVNMQLPCNAQPKAPVCDIDNVEQPNICWMLKKDKMLGYYGKCMAHCRANGPVCGHNGETYANECAAWSERVSVDYKGPCLAVGTSYGIHSKCSGVKCPPPPSEHCTTVFPPGGCCPICGAAIHLLYSQKLADWAVDAIRDVKPVVVQTIAEKIRERVKVTECEVFAYLSLESDIIVLFIVITDSPTDLQVQACVRESQKIETLIQNHSPTLLTELSLTFFTASTRIQPVTDCSSSTTVSKLIIILTLINSLIQRTL